MDGLPLAMPDFAPGSVWLTGAGPGDPALLTLAALHGLRHADAIVFDALVSEAVLALARPGVLREFAGKRGGKPSPCQADISLRLIRLARQGSRVLRLKGGDPMLFGRGAEEALALVAAGVPFRVVPGISAGLGGLAYAGISLTHRATNSVVTFLTGHDAGGVVPDAIDWAAVARGSPVIVMYMALRHLDLIAARLLAAGRRPDEPVAVVCDATLPGQRVVETTLGRAAADSAAAGLAPPAIVVLGAVVPLRAGLDWLGALAGRTLVADPLGQAGRREAG
jgi:uroporphyrin-III C-methyltransferase